MKALEDGANEKLSKAERAHAWFTAAWLARYDGMEVMGTEGAPDAFAESGSFEMPDLAKERRSGAYQAIAYDKEGNPSYDAERQSKDEKRAGTPEGFSQGGSAIEHEQDQSGHSFSLSTHRRRAGNESGGIVTRQLGRGRRYR